MNREELMRIVIWQNALVVVVAIVAWALFGATVAISAGLGGLCVSVPNSLLALNLIFAQMMRRKVNPMSVIIGEFLKMFAVCILFVLVAKLYPGLNWPAMITGIIAAVSSQFALLFVKH